MNVGPVANYSNVQNFTQQNAVAAQPPAAANYDARNSVISETQTQQAVKVADQGNRSNDVKERRAQHEERIEKAAKARTERAEAHRGQRGKNVDVSV